MDHEVVHVIDAYGLKPIKIKQIGLIHRIKTEQGTFALKKTSTSIDRLHAILFSLRELARLREDTPLYPIPDRRGNLYVTGEGGTYLLTPWIEGKSGNLLYDEPEGVKDLLLRLARMHHAMREEEGIAERLLPAGEGLLKRWNGRMKRMLLWKEWASRQTYPSPIDVVFMANVEGLMDMSARATAMLEESLSEWEKEESTYLTFCHGKLSPEHILIAEHPYFINFDHAAYDLPIRDLVYFLRQMLRRTRKTEDLGAWIEAYLSKNELDPFQRKLLLLTFLYPMEVTRFLEQYYEGKMDRSWHEIELVPRFERLMDEQLFFSQVASPPAP